MQWAGGCPIAQLALVFQGSVHLMNLLGQRGLQVNLPTLAGTPRLLCEYMYHTS